LPLDKLKLGELIQIDHLKVNKNNIRFIEFSAINPHSSAMTEWEKAGSYSTIMEHKKQELVGKPTLRNKVLTNKYN
jgi:hypothetical protein